MEQPRLAESIETERHTLQIPACSPRRFRGGSGGADPGSAGDGDLGRLCPGAAGCLTCCLSRSLHYLLHLEGDVYVCICIYMSTDPISAQDVCNMRIRVDGEGTTRAIP